MADVFSIKKQYHFHAAHRNEDLCGDRCFSIHGHTFYLDCHFSFAREPGASITMLYGDIDLKLKPIIELFEHCFIINRTDPILEILKDQGIKFYVMDDYTSAENLAKHIFELVRASTRLPLVQVDFRETTSAVVTYRQPETLVARA